MKDDRALPHIRELFLRHGQKKCFAARQPLKCEGDEAKEVCYITRGQVRAFCSSPDGEELTLFYIGAENMIFTESLTLSPARIIRNSETCTAVEMYALPSERFLSLWQEAGYPLQELLDHFVRRFELLHEYICCAHFRENDKRVAYLLYTSCRRNGAAVKYTHEQIAAITGINRVSVSRILNGLAREGIISLGYRKINVLDQEALSQVFDALGLPES